MVFYTLHAARTDNSLFSDIPHYNFDYFIMYYMIPNPFSRIPHNNYDCFIIYYMVPNSLSHLLYDNYICLYFKINYMIAVFFPLVANLF